MPARRSNAALLLQKVNTQLHGERVPLKSKDEDELAAYLNSLTLKAQQVRQIQEYGDNSMSSGADSKTSGSIVGLRSISPAVPAPASRFLKKKPTPDVATHTGSASTHDVASKKTESKAILSGVNKKKAPHQARSANEVEASIQSGKVSGRHQLVSRDSQSEISIQGPDVGQRPDSAEYIGRDASKFLKSNNFRDHDRNTASRFPIAQPVSNKKDEIARTLGSHFVPSDQDSLTEFIQGLSTSELSARRPQNLVTKKQQKWRKRASSSASHSPSPVQESRPQSPFRRSKSPFGKLSLSASQDSDMVDSMASEILDDRPGSSNSEQHFKINLMDVASLLPSSPSPPPPLPQIQKKIEDTHFNSQTQKHKRGDNVRSSPTNIVKLHKKQKPVSSRSPPKKTESSSSLLDALGIRMADELLSVSADGNRAVQSDISEESEIRTQSSHEHKKMLERQQSESSIVTDIGDERNKASSAKRNSFVTKARQISKNVDVTDVDITDVDEYSDSFNSESSARTASISQRSRDNRSRTLSTKKESNRRRDHKIIMEEMLVDVSATDAKGATRRWNTTHTDIHVSGPYGLQYVDPAPVATHIVSADALEAVTAYSPNMLALHEMMKVQLELVQNFVGIQQRIYQSCMDGLQHDYKYTTLEDTREYIRKNQKPRLTLKEALQLVEQEETITA